MWNNKLIIMTPHHHELSDQDGQIVAEDATLSFWKPTPAEIQCLIAGGSVGVIETDEDISVIAVMPKETDYHNTPLTFEHAKELLEISMRHGRELEAICKAMATLIASRMKDDKAARELIDRLLDATARPKVIMAKPAALPPNYDN
jgi:hypothetical protein